MSHTATHSETRIVNGRTFHVVHVATAAPRTAEVRPFAADQARHYDETARRFIVADVNYGFETWRKA
jgi:hypothetical protein